MSPILLHILILWGVLAVAIGLLWAISRVVALSGLPWPGVFGFIGATFGTVVGLTTFFASQHYAAVRSAAQDEAARVAIVVEMSGAFPTDARFAIRQQVYCYTSDVIDDEWPAMRKGDARGSLRADARLSALYQELLDVGRPNVPTPTNWYYSAVGAVVELSQDRQQRLLAGAAASIPKAMWVLIYVGSALMVVFTYFMHSAGRRQLIWMGVAVIVMLTALTGVLAGLDQPVRDPFGVSPSAMRIAQERLTVALEPTGQRPSCS